MRGLACSLLLATACTEPRTELILGIATDLSATANLDSVQLLLSVQDVPFHEETWTITGSPSMPFNLPGSFGIYRDGEHDRIQVRLIGLKNGSAVVTREAVLGFIDGKTSFYRMGLTSACMANTCPIGQTCVEGVCKSRDVDPTMFPSFDDKLVTELTCRTPGTPNYIDTATGLAMPLAATGMDCPASLCAEGTCLVPPKGGKTFKGVFGGQAVIDLDVDGTSITAKVLFRNEDAGPVMTVTCDGTVESSRFTATCDAPEVTMDGQIEGNRITGRALDRANADEVRFIALSGSDVVRYCGTFAGSTSGFWNFVTAGGVLTGQFDGTFVAGTLDGSVSGNTANITWNAGPTTTGTATGSVSDDRQQVNGTWSGTSDGSPVSGTFTNSTASCPGQGTAQ